MSDMQPWRLPDPDLADNSRVAAVLDEIADMIELAGENVYRAVSFRAAARTIRDLREPLRAYHEQSRLTQLERVGPSMAAVIAELIDTGTSRRHEELRKRTPEGLLDLLRVPGVGPATARAIYDALKVTTIDDLDAAARAGLLRSIPKVGRRAEENILRSIERLRLRSGRSLIHRALAEAHQLVAHLRERTGLTQITWAGSLRRMRETIGDIDILAAASAGGAIAEAFVTAPGVERVLARGGTRSTVALESGLQVDLRVVEPDSWGAALIYFTGSKEHNVHLRGIALRRGLLLNEYGLYPSGQEGAAPVAGRSEEDVYAALDMEWIPPELREDQGEIEAALERRLPRLVTREDIKGDLHTHSTWTDGRDSLEAMCRRARELGYEYVAVTDHSISLGMARGLSLTRIKERNREIARLNALLAPLRILSGTEVNIRADGTLDYTDDVLEQFEVVTASIHSAMQQSKEVMTQRILGAMENPLVDAISHPTGRLLERRDAYEVDIAKLIDAAARTGCRLEVNGGPERLDLPDLAVRRAVERGAPLVINSDAHALDELDWIELGVANARRGWASAAAVENTKGLTELLSDVARRRQRAAAR
jgi:DNA polymerase (family 10)